jgi:hypothetical protein
MTDQTYIHEGKEQNEFREVLLSLSLQYCIFLLYENVGMKTHKSKVPSFRFFFLWLTYYRGNVDITQRRLLNQPTLSNNPEDGRIQVNRSGSLLQSSRECR